MFGLLFFFRFFLFLIFFNRDLQGGDAAADIKINGDIRRREKEPHHQ